MSGRNARFRPGKGSFWGSKLKKKFFWDIRIFGLVKEIFPVGHTVAIFSNFFLQKIANLKFYFFRVVPSKNVDRSATNALCSQQSCCNKGAVLVKTCDFCDFSALWKAKAFLFSCKCHLHVLKCHLYTTLPQKRAKITQPWRRGGDFRAFPIKTQIWALSHPFPPMAHIFLDSIRKNLSETVEKPPVHQNLIKRSWDPRLMV